MDRRTTQTRTRTSVRKSIPKPSRTRVVTFANPLCTFYIFRERRSNRGFVKLSNETEAFYIINDLFSKLQSRVISLKRASRSNKPSYLPQIVDISLDIYLKIYRLFCNVREKSAQHFNLHPSENKAHFWDEIMMDWDLAETLLLRFNGLLGKESNYLSKIAQMVDISGDPTDELSAATLKLSLLISQCDGCKDLELVKSTIRLYLGVKTPDISHLENGLGCKVKLGVYS